MKVRTRTECETEALGAKLAQSLRPGDVVFLLGEPGAGKTAFARGVGRALGVAGVNSPTFALINEYPLASGGRLIHMDLYRLHGQEVEELGLEEYLYGQDICLIEWPEPIADWVERPIWVRIAYAGEGEREIAITPWEE